MERLRSALESGHEFAVTCELVPGRGYRGVAVDGAFRFVEQARTSGRVAGVSVTDNAGGNPALSPDALCPEILRMGSDVVVHFSCKDVNRNVLESRAYALKRAGVTNLLVVTGDYPVTGYFGQPKPVFDIDSVTGLHYLECMNRGLEVGSPGKTTRLEPTDFLLGCVVSPFKVTEASTLMQYLKLEKKLRAGARFVVTQLGYDVRKLAELIRYLRQVLGSDVPIMGSVYLLSPGAARAMNRGEVPGCCVTDELRTAVEEEAHSTDKGRAARLDRAAAQVAVLRGLGYAGVHLEGLNVKYADVEEILDRAAAIGTNWRKSAARLQYAPSGTYYCFEGGERLDTAIEMVEPRLRLTAARPVTSPKYWFLRALHDRFFVPGTRGYRAMAALTKTADKRPRLVQLVSAIELASKRALLDCRRCGDCAAAETYFTCPEARCPKGQRNGPCGGSRADGGCEVYPHRICIWETAYWRAKRHGEIEELRVIVPPRNWKLYETPSWINYYGGRDHATVKLEIPTLPAGGGIRGPGPVPIRHTGDLS